VSRPAGPFERVLDLPGEKSSAGCWLAAYLGMESATSPNYFSALSYPFYASRESGFSAKAVLGLASSVPAISSPLPYAHSVQPRRAVFDYICWLYRD